MKIYIYLILSYFYTENFDQMKLCFHNMLDKMKNDLINFKVDKVGYMLHIFRENEVDLPILSHFLDDIINLFNLSWVYNQKVLSIDGLTNIKEQHETEIFSILNTLRMDIKNNGKEGNTLEIEAEDCKISFPKWFNGPQGSGAVIVCNSFTQEIKIKVVNDGVLSLSFRGTDKRYNGIRIPIWIDYKSIKIDGKEILSEPCSTWHDKPYKHEMSVKNGQEIILEVEQKYHEYKRDELKDIILKLI